MSSWTVPITFTAASVLTAAQLNTEVRDHLNFIKGAMDKLTGGTTADTGNTMYLAETRTNASDPALATFVSGDSVNRFLLAADGTIRWGAGGASATDVTLNRSAANTLSSDSSLIFGSGAHVRLDGGGYVQFLENGTPAAAPVNQARLYIDDNGSGKTRLGVIFNTGAAQIIATQP